MNHKHKRYILLGPDGILASPCTFASEEAARAAIPRFCERYEAQGHYTDSRGVRIPVHGIPDRCWVAEVLK